MKGTTILMYTVILGINLTKTHFITLKGLLRFTAYSVSKSSEGLSTKTERKSKSHDVA
jgi:hypothetical protein